MQKIKKENSSYFKYIAEDRVVIDGLFKESCIRFSQPCVLNDPVEAYPKFNFADKEYIRYDIKFHSIKQFQEYQDFLSLDPFQFITNDKQNINV